MSWNLCPTELQVDKYNYGAFHRTSLLDSLQAQGVDTVVVTGTVTQICVDETARGAFREGLKAVMVSDAVSSFDPDAAPGDAGEFCHEIRVGDDDGRGPQNATFEMIAPQPLRATAGGPFNEPLRIRGRSRSLAAFSRAREAKLSAAVNRGRALERAAVVGFGKLFLR